MQAVALGEAFDGSDLLLSYIAHTGNAGASGLAIDQNSTCSALAFAAAILAARKVEVIAQHRQQAGIRIRVDAIRMSVDVELLSCRHPRNLSERAEERALVNQKPSSDPDYGSSAAALNNLF